MMFHSLKAKFIVAGFLLLMLSACVTNPPAPGGITDVGLNTRTSVVQPHNALSSALLDKDEKAYRINHSPGDTIIFSPDGSITSITTSGSTTTELSTSRVTADTGVPREDKSLAINAILGNTRFIQYAGIALIVAGAGIFAVFRVAVQSALVAGAGVGMIILQSQLANPVFTWGLLGVIVLLPAFWVYHLVRNNNYRRDTMLVIEQYAQSYPDEAKVLKNMLGRKMAPSTKQLVKQVKHRLPIEDENPS